MSQMSANTSSINNNNCYEIMVNVRCGKNLENRKLLGSNAPYVEVRVGNELKKTNTVSDLSNPCWNEKFKFKINNENEIPSEICLSVKDDRMLLPNPKLGDYLIKLDKQFLLSSLEKEKEKGRDFTIYNGLITLENTDQGLLDVNIWFDYYHEDEMDKNKSNLLKQTFNNAVNEATDVSELQQVQQPLVEVTQEISDLNFNTTTNDEYTSRRKEEKLINDDTNVQVDTSAISTETRDLASGVEQAKYKKSNQFEFEKAPDIALQRNEIADERKDEIKYTEMDKNEVHVLPTLHLKEKPTIIEREIEYEKPVEIKETIIHREKPIIIEQPIIKEKHEHYREATKHKKKNEKKVFETTHEQDVGDMDEQELLRLRKERIDQFNDTTPIVQHEKKHVLLDTDYREQPVQVHEKEVVYQQPVEIERTKIEKIKPTVHENVTIEKEHVHQKVAPEVWVDKTTQIRENDEFYSQDTGTSVTNSQGGNTTRQGGDQQKDTM